MDYFHLMFQYMDAFLIMPYRIIGIPIFGYLLGTFLLGMLCVIVGQSTFLIAWKWNRKWLKKDGQEMVRMHNLSLRALLAKDKAAWKACNKNANDAFGKYFFAQMAMGMSSLWPAPFALGWMDTRFAGVDFLLPVHLPFMGNTVGYLFTFIPLYVLAYILFGNIKHRLPFFGGMTQRIKDDAESGEEMLSWAELAETGTLK